MLRATENNEVSISIDLSKLLTERRNANSVNVDTLSTLDMLTAISQEDQQVAQAIAPYLPQIAGAIDKVATALQAGGRLICIGAGTSGRLGILDASECPPTLGIHPEQVAGITAGGHKAILSAVESVEDNGTQGAMGLQNLNFNRRDVLVGLAASGRTPYVIGAVERVHSQNAFIVIVNYNPHSEVAQLAGVAIIPVVGPEAVTGSTRLKTGTVQKLVLNMVSTGAMIHVSKVYSNPMVDVETVNTKLIKRQVSIVTEATDCDRPTARKTLEAYGRHCKTVIVMVLTDLSAEATQSLLTKDNGYIHKALGNT